jgi:glycopeptide antibiotics resistance protein
MAVTIRKGIKIAGVCLFLVYLAGLIYFLFLSEEYGRGIDGIVYDYNLLPFREIRRYVSYWRILGIRTVLLNLAGNVIGFMPFGVLLPLMAKSVRKAWRVALLSFEISALIEVSQLIFQVGCFDVDDMILNTLGGLLGYLLFRAAYSVYLRVEAHHKSRVV